MDTMYGPMYRVLLVLYCRKGCDESDPYKDFYYPLRFNLPVRLA